MATIAQQLAARRSSTAKLVSGTAYLPGGSPAATTGAHLPGGVGSPAAFTDTTPANPANPLGFTPAIPAAPTINPLIQAGLDQATTAANATRDNTIAGLGDQENQDLLSYGYTAKPGADGELDLSTLAVDPNNPFSKAALLKRSYDNSVRGNTTSYAANGQLYAGSLQNAQNESSRSYDEGSDALSKGLSSALAALIRQRAQARIDATGKIAEATGNAALQASGLKS